MKKFLAGAVALPFAICAMQSFAQGRTSQTTDSLYERGLQEMAPNWHGLGKTHDAAVFIHKQIRKTDNGMFAVWMHRELPGPGYIEKERAYLSTRDRIVVDCKNARIGATDMTYYSERFGNGAVVWATRKKPEMIEVVPDSVEDLLVKTACTPKPRKTAPKPKAAATKE